MTDTDTHIAELAADRDNMIEHIQFCEARGATRDREHAADKLAAIERQMRRIARDQAAKAERGAS